MIKKINSIKNFGVFKNFNWDYSVRDEGNNIAEFKKLNIIYGRNYSGKTTLSRLFRSFETGTLSDKYPDAQYKVAISETEVIDQTTIANKPCHIRVYNKDFLKDNLKFLTNEDERIVPFAVMGDQNIEIGRKIEEKELELGSAEKKYGILYDLQKKCLEYDKKAAERLGKETSLDDKLRNKANQDIKRNQIYKDVTYNIAHIKNDIETLERRKPPFLSEEDNETKRKLLKELPKEIIPEIPVIVSAFEDHLNTTKLIVEKEIKPSKPIQDLMDNAILQEWVRSGISLHKSKRNSCAFCGSSLPHDLWDKLDAHFSKESENLRQEIVAKVKSIEDEIINIKDRFNLTMDQFYAIYWQEYEQEKKKYDVEIASYELNLRRLVKTLQSRSDDIFSNKAVKNIIYNPNTLINLQLVLNQIIRNNNEMAKSLGFQQEKARDALRLNEVNKFLKEIGYAAEKSKIAKLISEEETLRKEKEAIQNKVRIIQSDIERFKSELKDESRGAEKVNEYLNHYFGHNGLRLEAEEDAAGSRFVIKRGKAVAYNLSEGECSLIAFCYFMAKLEEIESKDKKLIIWIDDPVSSLDNNHIFFVFSLIESVIAKPEKNPNSSNNYKYDQLFISTHSLEFLKYLMRLSIPKQKSEAAGNKPQMVESITHFLIENQGETSTLILMPSYLKKYVTEFNYLFNQIYLCSSKGPGGSEECYYAFGNNVRKFLEAFLFYKYPCHIAISEKLAMFFGRDKLAVANTNRIAHEYSHLEELFDRSMTPVDIAEMKRVADYVLDNIERNDQEQFKALLQSIGVTVATVTAN